MTKAKPLVAPHLRTRMPLAGCVGVSLGDKPRSRISRDTMPTYAKFVSLRKDRTRD
jgi:hypothetical protein